MNITKQNFIENIRRKATHKKAFEYLLSPKSKRIKLPKVKIDEDNPEVKIKEI